MIDKRKVVRWSVRIFLSSILVPPFPVFSINFSW